jgi:hypothetical protein
MVSKKNHLQRPLEVVLGCNQVDEAFYDATNGAKECFE